jgi:hypothetical protein
MTDEYHLIPAAFRTIMGQLPLIVDEDSSAYMLLLGELGVACEARSIVDWILVKDVTDLTWQILRIRRWIAVRLENGRKLGLATGIDQIINHHPGMVISDRAFKIAHENYTDFKEDANGRDGERRAQDLLDYYGLEGESVATANSFFRTFDTVEKAEELLARLEDRRNRTLREIESRRSVFGAKLRSASDMVIDAEADDRLPEHASPKIGAE